MRPFLLLIFQSSPSNEPRHVHFKLHKKSSSNQKIAKPKCLDENYEKIFTLLVSPTTKATPKPLTKPAVQSLVDLCFSYDKIPSPDTWRRKMESKNTPNARMLSPPVKLRHVRLGSASLPVLLPEDNHEINDRSSVVSIEELNNLMQSPSKANMSIYSSLDDLAKYNDPMNNSTFIQSIRTPLPPLSIQPRVAKVRIPEFNSIDHDYEAPVSVDPKYGTGPMEGVKFEDSKFKITKKEYKTLKLQSVIKPKKKLDFPLITPVIPKNKPKGMTLILPIPESYKKLRKNLSPQSNVPRFTSMVSSFIAPPEEDLSSKKVDFKSHSMLFDSRSSSIDSSINLHKSSSLFVR